MAIEEVSVEQLAERLAQGGVRLIDVREPDEYVEAHVPGAVLIPLATVPDHLDELRDGDGELLMICRSGARSMQACEFLAGHGLAVTNVTGGTMAWVMSGRDTMSGPESSPETGSVPGQASGPM